MKTKFLLFGLLLILPSIFFAQVAEPTDPMLEEIGTNEPHEALTEDQATFIGFPHEPTPLNLNELKALIVYPEKAKVNRIEGKVVLRILVDADGNYEKHIVLKTPDDMLTKAITDLIPRLKFTLDIQDQHPAEVWVTIPFDFRLTDATLEEKRKE